MTESAGPSSAVDDGIKSVKSSSSSVVDCNSAVDDPNSRFSLS